MAQLSPIHSWKLIGPRSVSAEKSGTVAFILRLILFARFLSGCGVHLNSFGVPPVIDIMSQRYAYSRPYSEITPGDGSRLVL